MAAFSDWQSAGNIVQFKGWFATAMSKITVANTQCYIFTTCVIAVYLVVPVDICKSKNQE